MLKPTKEKQPMKREPRDPNNGLNNWFKELLFVVCVLLSGIYLV